MFCDYTVCLLSEKKDFKMFVHKLIHVSCCAGAIFKLLLNCLQYVTRDEEACMTISHQALLYAQV